MEICNVHSKLDSLNKYEGYLNKSLFNCQLKFLFLVETKDQLPTLKMDLSLEVKKGRCKPMIGAATTINYRKI